MVHGQIILQQIANYPDEYIRRCAFVTGLVKKMEERGHTKLAMKKKSQVARGGNLNPSAKMTPISKRNLMRATTTKSASRIWGDYYATHFPEDSKEGVMKEICPRGNIKVVSYISLYHDKCLLFMLELY